MKKILLLLGCYLLFSLVQAQSIDTSYKTTYYEQKVTMFRLQPHRKSAIVFLGDSITDIGEWAEIWNSNKVKNRGISSDNTFGVLARLDEVIAFHPAKIFIMIGINDIARNTPDSIILANYKRIVQRLRAVLPGSMICVESLLPTNNEFTEFVRHQNKIEHIRFVNEQLQVLSKQYKLTYVDLFSRFLDQNGKLDKRYTNDGLHINGYGYELWKTILKEKGYMY